MTSVGDTLTGRGGNFIVINDPIKPADAMSDTTWERFIQWHGTTLLSRLDDKEHDAIIVVMQRLHVGDLAGHLLEQGGCEHLSLPAIAEVEQFRKHQCRKHQGRSPVRPQSALCPYRRRGTAASFPDRQAIRDEKQDRHEQQDPKR
jgi:hypothetical protein